MPTGKTISRNRHFDSAKAPATISATASGSGFAISAFLDLELEDVKGFGAEKLLSDDGITKTLNAKGTHVLEFVVAFTSKSEATCSIQCKFSGSDGSTQSRSVSVNGKAEDIARVSFHAPVS